MIEVVNKEMKVTKKRGVDSSYARAQRKFKIVV